MKMHWRIRWGGLFSLAVLGAVSTLSLPVAAGTLKFEAEVPKPKNETFSVLKLTIQPAPIALMNRLLGSTSGATKLTPLNDTPLFRNNKIKVAPDVLGVVEDEHVKAWANPSTGELAIYPNLTKVTAIAPGSVTSVESRTREIFESPEFIARDDTRIVIDKPQVLNGATLVRDPNGNTRQEKPKTPYLVYVSARRFVGDLPVDGIGSRALLTVSGSGQVEGLTRVWKSAKVAQTVRSSLSADQVRKAIAVQLQPAIKTSDVVVDRIELAYYDGNRQYLQPVYRFSARIHHLAAEARTADDFVIGYLPVGKAVEPLPVLGKIQGAKPATATATPKPPVIKGGAVPPNDPIVGRYVVRNDDSGWVNDANAFWSSLSSTWTGSLFSNSQYFWAEPRLFTNQKNSFINAMNLALIEVHGDWWLYSTLKNCCDLVNINGDIPAPGYGPSASGRLADWVIHSCEVVPGPEDTASWPNPWWTIFGGVRNVVGYRTIMYISDGAGGPYGSSLGNLAPVVSSWLSDVISLNAYSGHPSTPAHGGINRPMGRPSTISVCGHDADSVLSTSTIGRANCLTMWWFPD
jgi:hypothetical protein